jgi:hypothetical protein
MNITADLGLVNNEDLNRVTMKFICEKPLSHLLEDIGIMSRLCINLNNLSGILFSSRYSRKHCIISLSFKRSPVDKFLISDSPNVK